MSTNVRISGKKFALPRATAGKAERRPGGWTIFETSDGKRHRVFVHESRSQLSFSVSGVTRSGTVLVEERGSTTTQSDSDLVAQFPGKVRKVLVAVGAAVDQGQPLLLLEAMKMEFTIRAPAAGTVKALLVKEGQQHSPGDRLVDFEVNNGR